MNSYDIQSMNIDEVNSILKEYGEKSFRAKQIFQWLHEKQSKSYDMMTNIPVGLKERLQTDYPLTQLKEVAKNEDLQDKTVKYLFELEDGQLIETVLMSYKYGYSVCISSQVGCRMGCTFCASTLNGLTRQLLPSEMLEQIYHIERQLEEPIHSVVIMGTGEPFDNYENLQRFIELISYEKGRNLSRRHITVSTCGIIEKIQRFSLDSPQVNLAISLHSPYQEQRADMMPIAKKNELHDLIQTCHEYVRQTGRRISFEYSLIHNVNDTKQHALDLADLLKGLLCHVNLIPINPVDEKEQEASDQDHVLKFQKILGNHNIISTIRRSLGQNIDAACGQLRNQYRKNL
jgi:23S rRNA (adenine2503-C2)-methyltransferase